MSTEKKIEQYLHYYIGCEVEYEGILNGKEMGEELKANKHDVFYIPQIQPVKGKKIGILKSIDVDMDGNYRRARIGRKGLQSHWGKANFKPLLSKLEDMTEEDWLKCFELSRGVVDQAYPRDKITQLSTTERMIVLGKAQFVFGWHSCSDNDVRLGNGVCFYLKSYLIEESLNVSDSGIEVSDSLYNNMKEERVLNVTHIIHYLLKKGYDLFGLIEAGLAVDKKTQKII